MKPHRSVSQLQQYRRCPYAYYLARVRKVWQRPAAWLPHGTAFHSAREAYERSGRTLSKDQLKDIFAERYAADCTKLLRETPNTDFWSASGPYRAWDDFPRRFGLGLEMCDRYVDYYTEHPDERIWTTPSGDLAVELEVWLNCDGVAVVCFIDGIFEHPKYELIVRDDKTGKTPGDALQLKVYAMAVNREFNTEITRGDYWMGQTGRPGRMRDLNQISDAEVVDAFAQLDADVHAEKFDPTPSPDTCRMCSSARDCAFAVAA